MLNIDVLYQISKYLDIISLGRISKILSLPYSNHKLKYYKNEDFVCSGCQDSFDISETFEIILICEKNRDKMRCSTKYYFCRPCQYYYLICPKCSNENEKILCQFLGFCGYFFDSHRYRFRDKILINNIIKKLPYFAKYLTSENILEFNLEYGDSDEEQDCAYQDIIHKVILDTYSDKDFFYSFHFYDVTDLNLEYFDMTDCYPSGPYCNFPILWKCKNCLCIYGDT